MQDLTVAGDGLDGMAEAVAEVEQGAIAALGFITGNDVGLVTAAALDGFGQCGGVAGKQRLAMCLQPVEEGRIANRTVLDDFGQTSAQFAIWQGGQRVGVGDHGQRLVEGADQVLALRQVDRGLAADGGVDHGQQRGWQLQERYAAHPAGGGEAGEVADHAAAQRYHAGVAAGAEFGQALHQAVEVGHRLLRLAGGQDHHIERFAGQGRASAVEVMRRDVAVGNQQRLSAGQQGRPAIRLAEQAGADQDRVGAIAQFDAQLARLVHVGFRRHGRLPPAASGRRAGPTGAGWRAVR